MTTTGLLLIEPTAPLPRCFEVDAHTHPSAWTSIEHTLSPQKIESELSAAGWTFFFMARPVRVTAFAFNRDRALEEALQRCMRAATEQRCNALQIESVETQSFLGIWRGSLSIRPRHIQQGMLFGSPSLLNGLNLSVGGLRSNAAAT
jgi:hypothetical protein